MNKEGFVTIRITKNAEEGLERMIVRTNEGFTGGQVNRTDLVSWILTHFESRYLNECLEKVRRDHFDPVLYLESMVREAKAAKASGVAMPDMKAILSPLAESTSAAKRSKRLLKQPQNLARDEAPSIGTGQERDEHGQD